jgi:ferredoxin
MTYVITDICLGERYATCVSVCPVDCIKPGEYQGEEFMVILPEVCIDCGLCLPECPIGAIVDNEASRTRARNFQIPVVVSQRFAVAAVTPDRTVVHVLVPGASAWTS